jgi:SAM-dependent methyltransferase
MYTELAGGFHLITAPEEYAEEAEFYWQTLSEASATPPRTLLELGVGGGNNAFHYKRRVQATLTDLSGDMLRLSEQINPELEHIQGDMRGLRLGRQFDAVFVHDAVSYLGGAPTLVEAERLGSVAVAAFLVGYYLTIVGSNIGLALALHRWIGLLSQRLYRALLLLASLILAVYGVLLLGRALDYRSEAAR